MDPEEQLRLLQEALWYMRWALVFGIVALIVEVVAFVEVFQGNLGTFLILWPLAAGSWLFGYYLRAKARQYRRRADGVGK